MSRLAALLEVQRLDLVADGLRRERATLPERSALTDCETATAALERRRDEATGARDALAAREREVAGEVASLAAKSKEVEDSLYSGTVTVAKELEGLQQELAMWREKQGEAEERELALLEEIDTADAALADLDTERGTLDGRAAELTAAIRAAEADLDGRIEALETDAGASRTDVPAPVLGIYDRLRANARLAGRAAVRLEAPHVRRLPRRHSRAGAPTRPGGARGRPRPVRPLHPPARPLAHEPPPPRW